MRHPLPVPLPLTLLWAVASTWHVASWLAVFFYNVTVSSLLGNREKPQADFDALSSERRRISDHPKMLDDYLAGYEAASAIARRRSLAELHTTLCRFVPKARREFDWGAVDALTDALQERERDLNRQVPVL